VTAAPPDLSRLLRPKSVAVIGGAWARNVIEQCQKADYAGELWPVHPRETSVLGIAAYPSLAELPGVPDVAFVGINREASITALEQLAALGCGGAICFASGFSEAQAEDEQGADLEARLVAAAGSMPMIGPNCYGLLNYIDKAMLWPDQHGGIACERGVALLTQSSNIAISLTMQQRGLPIAYVMTAGNQAQLSLGHLGEALLLDDRVSALGMYIEGFGDVRDFEAMSSTARKLGKPIVALKAGRSAASQLAMQSHTNSLASDDAASDAFLKRLGIVRVNSLTVLLESLKLLDLCGPLSGNRVQSMSCSGGEASVMADAAESIEVEYPPLDSQQQRALREALGPRVALANPLDYHTYIWDDHDAMQQAFAAMMQGEADICCLLLDFPRSDRCSVESWYTAVDALAAAARESGKIGAVLATLPENLGEADSSYVLSKGLVPLCGVDDALQAIAVAAQSSVALGLSPSPILQPSSHASSATQSPGSAKASSAAVTGLSEKEAKAVLAEYGLSIPASATLTLQPSALGALEPQPLQWQACLAGLNFPVVLKAEGVAHKSDVGGVVAGLENEQDLAEQLLAMHQRLQQQQQPHQRLEQPAGGDNAEAGQNPGNSYLVETLIEPVVAELLVSVVRDPVLGLMLTLAAGGQQTEILRDTTHLLLPVEASDIVDALGSLQISRLLDGYRGSAPADRDALVGAILRVTQYAQDHVDRLLELEINPMLCTPDSAVVADAILRFTGGPHAH